ncbi:3-oxoacyl-ACP synthase III family protein [Polluticoccus soli]|uniref:3-oxoacyl-ACP synthase III family protein n=1 Tax=Polluticoccus soli TaxID=3034150 RepID=UPI0023E1F10A|nr:ketoacyl-ACP synthase III [Flavipsychrobacter sp. JY13-12]
MAYISGISYYTPQQILTNDTLKEMYPNGDIDKAEQITGIKKRHIAAKDESTSDLAIRAAEKLFTEYGIDKSAIDFVIVCTQTPDYYLPSTSCIVQNALGLSTTTGALDINMGCSGYVYSLGMAKGMVDSGIAKNVLLLTADIFSRFIHPNDKANQVIFGDAASATLVTTASGAFKLNGFVFGTDGSGAENLIVKEGAGKHFNKTYTESFDEYGNVLCDSYLYMNGNNVFTFTIQSVPVLIKQVLEKNNLELDNVDHFIFHQANNFILEYLRKKIKIPAEKFIRNIEQLGNTTSSTIPLAFKDAMDQQRFKAGEQILLAGYGVGFSWAGATVTAS